MESDNEIRTHQVSALQVQEAANAILGNPDTTVFQSPPDGQTGVATLTSQTLTTEFRLSDFAGGAEIWVVQWPNLARSGSVTKPKGTWVLGFQEDGNGVPGRYYNALDLEAWTGYATTLEIGGLVAYIMAAGESPFPTKAADRVGPKNPIATIRLDPGTDMLHDIMRLLGGSYEVVDTTAKLYQQGSSISCAIDNPKCRPVEIFRLRSGWNNDTNVVQSRNVQVYTLPFGSPSDMTKVPNSKTLTAGQGVYAPLRMNLEDNRPDFGLNTQQLFVGPVNATCQTVNSNNMHVCLLVEQGYNIAWTQAAGPVYSNARGQSSTNYTGKLFPTASDMSQTVITGIDAAHFSCRLQQKLVTQCFISAASDGYLATAHPIMIPSDPLVMAALGNAQRGAIDFYESAANANGSAWRRIKGTLGKTLKAIKPVAAISKDVVKSIVKDTLPGLVPAPALAAATETYKGVQRARKVAKANAQRRKSVPQNNKNK